MTDNKLGSWANPPLAYVVAEIVISPHYTVAKSIPAIQQALRDEYPRTIEAAELTIELAGPNPSAAPQPVWQFLTADSRRGVQIGTRAISLHATQYPHFPAFTEWLRLVLQGVDGSGLDPFVERIGLRYIDYILPSEGHEPSEYLDPALRGVSPKGATGPSQTSMWVASFPFGECKVNARVAAPAPVHGDSVLPPNFAMLPLVRPEMNTMDQAGRFAKEGRSFGFIDTDCGKKIGKRFEVGTLVDNFSDMHDCISDTFKAFMSDLAKQEWVK